MKHTIKYALCLAALTLSAAGCNREPEMFSLPNPDNKMNVKPSAESVVVEKDKADETALTFTWDEAYSYGPNYTVEYSVVLKRADLPEEFHTEPETVAGRSYSVTGTVLNELLATWKVVPGEAASLDFEVIATSTGPKYRLPEVSTATVSVTGYDINNHLTMIVTRGGRESAYPMSETVVATDKFQWDGELLTGDRVRFVRSMADGSWPAYVEDAEGSLALKEEAAGAGALIEIAEWNFTGPSTTRVTVDMGELCY
jgi:hypothetical protein